VQNPGDIVLLAGGLPRRPVQKGSNY